MYWLKEIDRNSDDNVMRVIVGNKLDLFSGKYVSHWMKQYGICLNWKRSITSKYFVNLLLSQE